MSNLAKNNSATVLMEKNNARNEQYWEFLKKLNPSKMRWQELRLTRQLSTT